MTGAAAAASNKGKPLAVSLMLEKVWAVYDAAVTNPDEERLARIITLLKLDVHKRGAFVLHCLVYSFPRSLVPPPTPPCSPPHP